ncbi:MAG: sigma-70 family RNA polymerase sigma factor [Bryobacteraceae bacterium]
MAQPKAEITGLLAAWREGDESALDKLMPVVYEELRSIARRYLRSERAGHTLQSTALVNEAYLALAGLDQVKLENRAHFFGLASQIIRNILVSHARKHAADKRGGGQVRLSLDTAIDFPGAKDMSLVMLDDALQALAKLDPQQARIIELRFFGGLGIDETAALIGVSPATVKRDWTMARNWIYREMQRGGTRQ